MFFRKDANQDINTNKNGVGEEPDILEIIEIISKNTQLEVKKVNTSLSRLVELIPTIKELKEEIKELKAELRTEKDFNKELIHKLIDKTPVPQSAAEKLAAIRAVNEGQIKPSGLAAVEKAAKK